MGNKSTKSTGNPHRNVKFIYALLASVTFICIVFQVFLAGLGTFANSADWKLHTTFVTYFEFLPIVMFLFSFVGRIRGSLRWVPLGLYALITFQHLSVQVFSKIGTLAAFHTVAALLLFWGSMHAARRSLIWLSPGRSAKLDREMQG